jgi:hypothetical protein
MQATARTNRGTNEEALELKYCERCGGLWLRPVGGGQIYCAPCSHEMSELPPSSNEPDDARMPGASTCDGDGDYYEGYVVDVIDRDAEEERRHEWIN